MMNLNEKLEIAKRLRLSTETELSRDDLEKLLEAELAKPEAKMDAELVQMILEVLEDEPTKEQQQESWQQIDKKLTAKRHWFPAMNGLAKIAAAVVVLVAVTFATYGTAQAFNWEFLLRWMKPLAETFMLYTGNNPAPTIAPQESEVYGDALSSIVQTEFTSLEESPDELAGYPAKPVWMPERFAYVQGSMYSDWQVQSITHLFLDESGLCIIDVVVYTEGNDINSYSYELLPEEDIHDNPELYQLQFYKNSDDATLTASWVIENAHYSITGQITEEEIIDILKAMMK